MKAVGLLPLAASLTLVVIACVGPSRTPEIVTRDASVDAIADVVADASDREPDAGTTADAADARAARCDGASDDAGVIDVYLALEPVPREEFSPVESALVVEIPALRIQRMWSPLPRDAAKTCVVSLGDHATSLHASWNTFESSSALDLGIVDSSVVAFEKAKSYDYRRAQPAFEPIPLPCGAHVVFHGLLRRRAGGGKGSGADCFSRCLDRTATCLLSCQTIIPRRSGVLSATGVACDLACQDAAACEQVCSP